MEGQISIRRGLLSLSPLLVFLLTYFVLSLLAGDFYAVPITVAFLIACGFSLLTMRSLPMGERFQVLVSGASRPGLMTMIWIFILAGAFAATAKQAGAIDATVQMAVRLLPSGMILCGVFLAACFISLSVGTSVGTIAALTPIAGGMAQQAGYPLPLTVAIVVGGAFFGDNLSFISDTTIMATKTQGCRLRDKFRSNVRIAVPAAMICIVLYLITPIRHRSRSWRRRMSTICSLYLIYIYCWRLCWAWMSCWCLPLVRSCRASWAWRLALLTSSDGFMR